MLSLALLWGGCVDPSGLKQDHDALTRLLATATQQGAQECMPLEMGTAEANENFVLLEFEQGDTRRARDHLDLAMTNAQLAVDGSVGCLTQDTDGDGIVDLDDRCIEEPEDIDGDRDDDGCPDIEPDPDEDGLTGEQDRCPDDPEDFDEFEDEDGCPDPDNDQDGLADEDDGCPNEAEGSPMTRTSVPTRWRHPTTMWMTMAALMSFRRTSKSSTNRSSSGRRSNFNRDVRRFCGLPTRS